MPVSYCMLAGQDYVLSKPYDDDYTRLFFNEVMKEFKADVAYRLANAYDLVAHEGDWIAEVYANANEEYQEPEKEKEEEKEKEKDECIICYETLVEGNVKLKCNHKYCLSCFVQHMRTKSECAYCRQEVCDLPPPKKVLEMSTDTRRAILDHFMENAEDLAEMFKADFMRQMRASIIDQQQEVRSRTTERMINMCVLAADSVDLSFAMWSSGIRVAEYMSDWYER
jgi:hypothetical protein